LFHNETETIPLEKTITQAGDDGEDKKSRDEPEARLIEKERLIGTAGKLWRYARKNHDQLVERLHALCPSEEQAPNLWPAALFMFLSTLAVLRTAKRIAPDVDIEMAPEYLCDRFLELMLQRRKQPEDFCCPKNFRYRHEEFPSLADDLRKTFGIKIPTDLSAVMLAIITDKKIRTPDNLFHEMWTRYLNLVCDLGFQLSPETADTCCRTWRRFIASSKPRLTDDDFKKALDSLWSFR